MNLDSPEPEIWVLLYWEGHPAAVRYEVEHFVDEGDFTGFVGMDEYRVNTDERYGTFESIRSPRVRNNNANIICEDVVVPVTTRSRVHQVFGSLNFPRRPEDPPDPPVPTPPPQFALSTVSDDTFLTETRRHRGDHSRTGCSTGRRSSLIRIASLLRSGPSDWADTQRHQGGRPTPGDGLRQWATTVL